MLEGLGIILLALLGGITVIAFFLVLKLLFPHLVADTREAVDDLPGRAFLIGLVNALFLAALIAGSIALADSLGIQFFQIPALLLLVLLGIGWAMGLAGMVQLVGGRLFPEREVRAQSIWGGIVLILACLTPYVGWFGLLPYVSLLGLGGFIMSLLRRRRKAVTAEAVSEA